MNVEKRLCDPYEWYILEAEAPEREGGRHTPRVTVMHVADTLDEVLRARAAYFASLSPALWPEGDGVRRVNSWGGRSEVPGRLKVYYHGPLGWMEDEGYTAGIVSHGSDCPKCRKVRAVLDALYPGMGSAERMRMIPEEGRWEWLESLCAGEGHEPAWAARRAGSKA